MVPLVRIDLDDELASRLDTRTTQLAQANADSAAARAAWRSARDEKRGIRDHLVKMAPGVQRCMYCGDSLGTDIDHFEPIREFPAGTFVWRNHLLACSYCNSNAKRDLFPRDAAGTPLLIDPTSAVLCRADDLLAAGRAGEATRCLRALGEEPHASVLHAMLHTVTMPGAADVLGTDVLAALTNPALLALLRPAR